MRIAQLTLIKHVVSKWQARKFRDAIICHHCLRRTRLVKSRYAPEKRYCEHCARELDNTNDPGKIVLTFGKVTLAPQGKMFLLADGDFEEFDQAKMALDVTDIYIDAATYSPLLLEKCLLHLFNYPPAQGVKAIRVFHTGSLDDLNPNIKALLQHHFTHIEPVNVNDTQATPQLDDPKPTFTHCAEHPNRAYFPPQARCPWCEWFALPTRTPTLVKHLANLKNKDWRVVKVEADALIKIGDARAVDALITILKDKDADSSARSVAAKALGKISDARAVKPLIAVLKDKEPFPREGRDGCIRRNP